MRISQTRIIVGSKIKVEMYCCPLGGYELNFTYGKDGRPYDH